ncbi:D-2-hydroxyacid dehydrogenase [Nesterenkonia natronophila]|uniref:D-2-hydroxyacid dehydrogenase n=1 Tax=Nesterenkonia natronophila TaxID=2174932 RepID=A0A3A4F4Y8_9MICC|nr:D-2-hydroxyacid dehydrogenase [Nesterenkonia natronophila]RJN32781.1 D-2-hydroxyacid dehydrogenase [Nesterenkonia natronophila]
MSESRQVITVLRPADPESPHSIPPGLDQISDSAEVRLTDAEHIAGDIAGSDALFLWDFFSGALQEAWPAADRLKWIHVAAAGVDTLLFDELRASDVTVTNSQGIFDRPIAEWVLGAILAEAKDFHGNFRLKTTKTWDHRETTRVQGATAIVIGTGAIGREIARLLTSVGVNVTGAGRTARENDEDFGVVVASEDLEEHVGGYDIIVNAAPLTAATVGLIGATTLAAVKPGAHLINIGRGASVDENALITALREGPLGFASLDVFEEEPLPQDSALWELENVMIASHMSGDVHGWRDSLAELFIDNAQRWLDGKSLFNVVDKDRGYVPGKRSAS